MQRENPMALDQPIRTLCAPLHGLLKKMGLSSPKKQISVVRTNSQVVGTNSQVVRASNVDCDPEPSATFRQAPPGSLPVELWIKIIHELSHQEWIALREVCWFLYQITQPFWYENITLWEGPHFEIFKECIGNPQLQFKRTIDQRQELGAYVRSLALFMDDDPGPNNHSQRYPLLSELHLLPNLESLQILYIYIDLDLCNILHSHPRLKSVTVAGCTLDESLAIAGIDRDLFPHSSISTVKVSYPKRNPAIHAWAALVPAKLESLAVRSTSPPSDAGLILTCIMESNKTSFLTTLHLDTFSPVVATFLIASPQLRHLTLDSWSDNSPSPLMSLLADAIPFLGEYIGPAEISPTFIRGRPVHTVKFISPLPSSEDRLAEIVISLQYSAGPVTSLGLDLHGGTLGPWLSHIPVNVRYLAADHLHWLDFEKQLPAISHLTSLHTLSCKYTRVPHREEVMKISNACQSLREIDGGGQRWSISEQRDVRRIRCISS